MPTFNAARRGHCGLESALRHKTAQMKITSIKTFPVSVPQPRPRFSAHELTTAFSAIVTEVRTDEGLVGHGQIHGRPMQDICDWVKRLSEIVIGMDPLEHGH